MCCFWRMQLSDKMLFCKTKLLLQGLGHLRWRGAWQAEVHLHRIVDEPLQGCQSTNHDDTGNKTLPHTWKRQQSVIPHLTKQWFRSIKSYFSRHKSYFAIHWTQKCARHKLIIQPYLNVNQVQEVSSVKVNCSQSCTPEPLRHNRGLIAGMPWLKLLPQHRSCWEALLLQQWMVLNLVSYCCWNNWNNVDTNLWVPASWGPA